MLTFTIEINEQATPQVSGNVTGTSWLAKCRYWPADGSGVLYDYGAGESQQDAAEKAMADMFKRLQELGADSPLPPCEGCGRPNGGDCHWCAEKAEHDEAIRAWDERCGAEERG